MEFDLKTACSLIPVMNNNGNNIKGIIDSVEMYSEMLSEAGKKLLIKFVVKSRLSENAKLRVFREYTVVNDLITDLRKNLLPKQSFTAIQSRLLTAKQGWRTIDQYATEIEKLFTNLTVSQADGNSNNYAVLQPLNEKLAIKRFSEGLRDSRLSTIIAARNYENLMDATQGAKDEELSAESTPKGDEKIMNFSRGRGKSHAYNNFRNGQINYRGNSNSNVNSNYRDTGASLSVIKNDSLPCNSAIIGEETSVNGIAGQMTSTGFVHLSLMHLEDKHRVEFDIKLHIFDNIPLKADGILGLDFLCRYASNINLKTNIITLSKYGMEYSLKLFDTIDYSNEVLHIPARRSIGKVRNNRLPVKILNMT
ncbi:Uncharacterized protein OBRU01_10041 [Operophtera brumata]|uniref:Retropepsins domain-containing protein n=1 Tax=Operophtera brumata TaxID=104452 RepID=A0A0L7LEJ8_OPEBR|nr:Uncharacterized protein OBRU01_10041 [Operophtera brumata]